MANYSLVSNAVFQPFTYQELAAPLDRQDAYHESLMQQYEQLSDKADVLEAMGANDRDNKSGAYTKYKSYSDKLRKEADNLYQFGLNTESRQRLTDLRRMYNQEIVPIQNAWNKREEEAKMQLAAKMQNPSLMFTRDAANSSLDTYLANPTGGFGVINKATITAQMAGMAKNLAEQIRSGKLEGIDAFTAQYITEHGLDANLINAWIQNPDSYPTLTNMMNQVLAANGVTAEALQGSPNAEAIFAGATNAAQMGAWEAMGKDQAQIIERFGAREALKHANAVDLQNRSFAHQVALKSMPSGDAVLAAQGTRPQGNNNLINPLPLRSQQEVTEKNRDIQDYIKKGYVEQDPTTGQFKMTRRGWEEYRRNATPRISTTASGGGTARLMNAETQDRNANKPFTSTKFRKFMDELNGGKSFVDAKGKALPGWGPNRAGNLFAQGIKLYEEGSYDTYHTTEYDRQLDSTYGTEVTKQLWSAARAKGKDKVLDVVEFNGKDGWRVIKSMTPSDLDGYKATNTRYSKFGDTVILQKEGENPIRVRIPKGLNLGAQQNVQSAIANADEYAYIMGRGKRPMFKEDGYGNIDFVRNNKGDIIFTNENLSAEDVSALKKLQRDALNEMGSYGSQYVVASKTADEEYKPFDF